MPRLVQLSYGIDEDAPLYPGTPPSSVKAVKKIDNGDSCNTYSVTISDHIGTHVDAPRHFLNSGKAIGEYLPHELIFARPCIIDCPKAEDEAIGKNDLRLLSTHSGCDALLIRTGFGKYRKADPGIYSGRNPYLLPEAGEWMRRNFPKIRLMGIDTISISSSLHRPIGAETHRVLLTKEGFAAPPVLLAEDMNLPSDVNKLDRLIVVPLFTGLVDSSPCAILGVTND